MLIMQYNLLIFQHVMIYSYQLKYCARFTEKNIRKDHCFKDAHIHSRMINTSILQNSLLSRQNLLNSFHDNPREKNLHEYIAY